jgi:very-short-patch-repair endonuclease
MPKRPFTPYDTGLTRRARELRAALTEPERRLWFNFLRGFPHRVQRQKPLGYYIADFYCAHLRLVIEIDGDSHYMPGSIDRDQARDTTLARLDLRVLRFTNDEVMHEFEAVCARIWAELDRAP